MKERKDERGRGRLDEKVKEGKKKKKKKKTQARKREEGEWERRTKTPENSDEKLESFRLIIQIKKSFLIYVTSFVII